MAYGARANVKSNLHIDSTISTADANIDRYLGNFGNWFDNQVTTISNGTVPVPVTTPAVVLNEINSLADRWATAEYKIWNPKTDPSAIAAFNNQLKTVKDEAILLIKNFLGGQNDDLGVNLLSKGSGTITGNESGSGQFG